VPGGAESRLHASLSRAATLAAQAAEAAGMARVRARSEGGAATSWRASADAVDRAVAQVEALVLRSDQR
jgi:hypothetical protein